MCVYQLGFFITIDTVLSTHSNSHVQEHRRQSVLLIAYISKNYIIIKPHTCTCNNSNIAKVVRPQLHVQPFMTSRIGLATCICNLMSIGARSKPALCPIEMQLTLGQLSQDRVKIIQIKFTFGLGKQSQKAVPLMANTCMVINLHIYTCVYVHE